MKGLDVYVHDRSFRIMDVAEEIQTLIWTRRYDTPGEFKILAPYTKENARLLRCRNLIGRDGDKEFGEIQYMSIHKNNQGHEEIEVQGKFITNWLRKRLSRRRTALGITPRYIHQRPLRDTVQDAICGFVARNMIRPGDSGDAFANLSIADIPDLGTREIEYTVEYDTDILVTVEALAKTHELGFCIQADAIIGQMYFWLYRGVDRSIHQTEHIPCVFSPENDNVLEMEYTHSIENFKSQIIAYGDPVLFTNPVDSPAYTLAVITARESDALGKDKLVGIDRVEGFVDVADGTRITTMDYQQHMPALEQHGKVLLEQYREAELLQCKIDPRQKPTYRADYDVGDIVTCRNGRWGVMVDMRVISATETYSADKPMQVDIELGERLPTLAKQIRNHMR